MKQWGRHASHLHTDRLRPFIFSVSPCPRWPAFNVARVVLRTSRRFSQHNAHRVQFHSLGIGRAREYAACFDPIVGGNQQEEENMKIASLITALVATAALTAFAQEGVVQDVKHGAKKAGETIKDGLETVGEKTKETAQTVGRKTKETA